MSASTYLYDYAIAADATPCGGSRDVYTLEETGDLVTGYLGANLRKWTFPANGSYPVITAPTLFDIQDYPAYSPKAKILTVGSKKYFSFISGGDVPGSLCNRSRFVALWDISDAPVASPAGLADIAAYDLGNDCAGTGHDIYGFEHVNQGGTDYIYISFMTYPSAGVIDAANSGLAFFTTVTAGTTATSYTLVASTSSYDYTDLELAKNGDLFMVNNSGSLAYLSSFGSSSIAPTLVTNSCGGYSVANNINHLGTYSTPFYLGKQFPGESKGYVQITGLDINSKCAPGFVSGSPVPQFSVTVTGGTPFTTGPSSYQYLWVPESLGVHSLNDAVLSSTVTASPQIIGLTDYSALPPHGPLLTADFWLTVTDANNCQSSMRVKTHLETTGYDLASKDSPFDLYDEPNDQQVNSANNDIWHSPDIWNSYSASGGLTDFTNYPPKFFTGSTPQYNYLFVKVRNVGCKLAASDPPIGPNLYWTLGGWAESWPQAWGTYTDAYGVIDGYSVSPTCSSSGTVPTLTDGANILSASAANVAGLAAGYSTIKYTEWIPPNPDIYDPVSCSISPAILDLCFLSRIVDYQYPASSHNPDGMAFQEIVDFDITTNVLNNNNIVTLNTSVADVSNWPPIRHHMVMLGSGELGSRNFSLQFANNFSLLPGTGISTLSNYVNIKVFLGPLFHIWQAAGGYGTYSSINPDGSVSFDGSNTMRLDSITLDSGVLYPVEVEFDMLPGVDGRQIPKEMVNLRELYFCNPTDTTIDSAFAFSVDSTFDTTTSIMSYDTLYSTVYDTFYTPGDTVYSNYSWVIRYIPPPPPCPGVLTVTELSNGPDPTTTSTAIGTTRVPASGCNYGELLVSGCGQCSSATVNIAGWIIDDNDGSFDLAGCSALAGVTQSHYRLAYDSIWRNVPVGSMIVVYNLDSNCYNLPDTFTITPGTGSGGALTSLAAVSLGNTYYVPLGGAEAYPLGTPHIQRFSFTLDSTLCNYVVDTITSGDSTYDSSYYTYGGNWANTINFDTSGDAFQVRCPRCDRDMGTQPAFYHGFGYGTDTGANQFASIPADSNSLGGAVIHNRGAGYKYCFTGSTAAHLGDPAYWQQFPADAAGAWPHTLGNVNSEYGLAAQNNALNLPCCSPSTSHHHHHHDDARSSDGNNGNSGNNPASARNVNINGLQSTVQSLQNLSVFPSPATMTLNFQYTTQANVTIKLFDVTGRLMDEQVHQNSTAASFNVASYAPGIYLYQVITNTSTQSGKVLIGN